MSRERKVVPLGELCEFRAGVAFPIPYQGRPRGDFPYGEQCGRFVTASVILDAGGLRQAP